MVSSPEVSVSPGSWLELHGLRPQPTPVELETVGVGLSNFILTSSPGNSDVF